MEHYRSVVLNRLSSAKTPADHARIISLVHREHTALLEEIRVEQRVTVACSAGCFYCCHIKVDAHAHEIIFLLEQIYRTLNKTQIENLLARCENHSKRLELQSLEEQLGSNNPCPLLIEGKCQVYSGRPLSCRNYHAQDIKPCIKGYEDPSNFEIEGTENKLLQGMGASVWIAVKTAYSEAGYDGNTYDLGLALYEGLTNPKCAKRWRDKKAAFSKSCIVKDQKPL